MKVSWKLSIGFPTAVRKGILEIPDDDLEGLDDETRDDYIADVVHEHSMQFVSTSWEIED